MADQRRGTAFTGTGKGSGTLQHDMYKGIPCMNCNNCSGFQMHVFRKRCMNCGCAPEQHKGYGADLGKDWHNDTEGLDGDFSIFEQKRLEKERRERERAERERLRAEQEAAENARRAAEAAAAAKTARDAAARAEAERLRKEAEAAAREAARKAAEEKKKLDFLNGLSWVPAYSEDVPLDDVIAWINALPKDQQPTQGNRSLDEKFSHQCPAHDLHYDLMTDINKSEGDTSKKRFDDADRKRQAARCNPVLRKGPRGTEVYIPELGKAVAQNDLKCIVCKEIILNHQVYKFGDPPQLYCERHWAESADTKKHRCEACDELILSGKITKIEEEDGPSYFHVVHFTCNSCEKPLGGLQYFRDEVTNHPLCEDCFYNTAPICPGCGQPCIEGDFFEGLGPNQDQTWHAECYACSTCGNAYANMETFDGKLFCNKHLKEYKLDHDVERVRKAM